MGNYNMDPRKQKASHMFMTEIAVHFYGNGINFAEDLENVDFKMSCYVPSNLQRWMDTIYNIDRLASVER